MHARLPAGVYMGLQRVSLHAAILAGSLQGQDCQHDTVACAAAECTPPSRLARNMTRKGSSSGAQRHLAVQLLSAIFLHKPLVAMQFRAVLRGPPLPLHPPPPHPLFAPAASESHVAFA